METKHNRAYSMIRRKCERAGITRAELIRRARAKGLRTDESLLAKWKKADPKTLEAFFVLMDILKEAEADKPENA